MEHLVKAELLLSYQEYCVITGKYKMLGSSGSVIRWGDNRFTCAEPAFALICHSFLRMTREGAKLRLLVKVENCMTKISTLT